LQTKLGKEKEKQRRRSEEKEHTKPSKLIEL
jgi:hypothetical protein